LTPILILSGHNDASRVKAALEAGASDFLAKPLVTPELKARLENILRNNKAIVRSGHYRGPDRRHRKLWIRHDRRRQEPPAVQGP
jgi:DNA-binding response OmpR family regulator